MVIGFFFVSYKDIS